LLTWRGGRRRPSLSEPTSPLSIEVASDLVLDLMHLHSGYRFNSQSAFAIFCKSWAKSHQPDAVIFDGIKPA
jgi:hypothetical protein